MRIRAIAFLVVLAFVLLLSIFKPDIVERLSLRVEDTKFLFRNSLNMTPPMSDSVVVVAIDERSVNELGRWPWSRKVLARLIDNLSEARVVALDIVFSEPENEESDGELARAIADAGNVVLGFFFRFDGTQEPTEEMLSLLQDSEFLRYELEGDRIKLLDIPYVELSLPVFLEYALATGYLNAEPDPDAVYRHYTLANLYKGSIYLPLALQALRFYENKDFEMELSGKGIKRLSFMGRDIPVYEGRFHKINFYDVKKVKPIPAVDVIKGRIDPSYFRDKAVFVGATEIGIYDVRPTPMDPVTPGVYLHLFTFSNFKEGHFIYQYRVLDIVAVVILCITPFIIAFHRNFYLRIGAYGITLVGFVLLSFLLFSLIGLEFNIFYPVFGLILSVMSQEGILVFTAERSVRELRRAFSSYVSPQLLEIITKNPDTLTLGGEKRLITVLFSDIRGFTTISEGLSPEDLVNLLNEYLNPMTQIILREGGMLDKYIGDAIMAVFNAPVDIDRQADRACRSALEMVRKTQELSSHFKDSYGVEVRIGVGINTGEAVVGNMGSDLRFDYTAIGDTVNLASRLEGLNKLYGTSIIISEFTKEKLEGEFLTRKLDVVVVKGKKEPVPIYELMEDSAQNREKARAFEEALEEYFRGNFDTAMVMFEEVSIRFGDSTSRMFLSRCREMIENPPEDWKGVYVAKEK